MVYCPMNTHILGFAIARASVSSKAEPLLALRRENTLFRLYELWNIWLSLARWKPDSFSTMTLDVPALGNILVLIPLDCKRLYFGIAMAASPGCDVKVAKVTARPSAMCSDIHIGGSNKSSKENNFWNWTFKCIWMIICSSFFADT